MKQGDLYIFLTDDGGNISVRNGEPETDLGLETAINISIYGHDGTDFWMNEYLSASEQLQGNFIRFLRENPKTVKNMNQAEGRLRQDLQWVLDDEVADVIEIDINSPDRNITNYDLRIYTSGELIYKNDFQINWMAQANNPASGRI